MTISVVDVRVLEFGSGNAQTFVPINGHRAFRSRRVRLRRVTGSPNLRTAGGHGGIGRKAASLDVNKNSICRAPGKL